ncbi:hypothetical protein NDU88_002939 [Pleurodeles waltl]|uniref:Myb-like domain-containing protein n=1 Tax=Pleurodeles waltl TaxID=8319 RepID=A0AAV7LQN0_PLEWA|nr:hypothetical protein NDU88_002939 [Pleurodeles waltl]
MFVSLQFSAHQNKGKWRAIAKNLRTLGVYDRRSTHCRKEWEDLRCWERKMAEAQLGNGPPTRKGCLLDPDPPDVPHIGGGLSGVGWALEGITAATRGIGRTQASTLATQSTATVVLAATAGVRGSKETPVSTGSVPAPAGKKGPPATKGKEAPPAGKGKEAPRAGKGKKGPPATKGNEAPPVTKGKEAPPATKGKEAPPAGKGKEAPPAGKGK